MPSQAQLDMLEKIKTQDGFIAALDYKRIFYGDIDAAAIWRRRERVFRR